MNPPDYPAYRHPEHTYWNDLEHDDSTDDLVAAGLGCATMLIIAFFVLIITIIF